MKISFCGDICSECPRYIASQTKDIKELETLAELWYRLGFRDKVVSAEELMCNGCSRDKICSYNINSCEHIKDINSCGECSLFPCEKINQVLIKTDNIKARCQNLCSPYEFSKLHRAFLMKKEVLQEINDRKRLSKKN